MAVLRYLAPAPGPLRKACVDGGSGLKVPTNEPYKTKQLNRCDLGTAISLFLACFPLLKLVADSQPGSLERKSLYGG